MTWEMALKRWFGIHVPSTATRSADHVSCHLTNAEKTEQHKQDGVILIARKLTH